jgi:hypothetical protein
MRFGDMMNEIMPTVPYGRQCKSFWYIILLSLHGGLMELTPLGLKPYYPNIHDMEACDWRIYE